MLLTNASAADAEPAVVVYAPPIGTAWQVSYDLEINRNGELTDRSQVIGRLSIKDRHAENFIFQWQWDRPAGVKFDENDPLAVLFKEPIEVIADQDGYPRKITDLGRLIRLFEAGDDSRMMESLFDEQTLTGLIVTPIALLSECQNIRLDTERPRYDDYRREMMGEEVATKTTTTFKGFDVTQTVANIVREEVFDPESMAGLVKSLMVRMARQQGVAMPAGAALPELSRSDRTECEIDRLTGETIRVIHTTNFVNGDSRTLRKQKVRAQRLSKSALE